MFKDRAVFSLWCSLSTRRHCVAHIDKTQVIPWESWEVTTPDNIGVVFVVLCGVYLSATFNLMVYTFFLKSRVWLGTYPWKWKLNYTRWCSSNWINVHRTKSRNKPVPSFGSVWGLNENTNCRQSLGIDVNHFERQTTGFIQPLAIKTNPL